MDRELFVELIRLAPQVVLLVFLVLFGSRLFPILRKLVSRTTRVSAFGFTLEFADQVQEAVQAIAMDHDVAIAKGAGRGIVSRAQRLTPVLRNSAVVWIDEDPLSNLRERRVMEGVGIRVDTVHSIAEANAALEAPVIGEVAHGAIIASIECSTDTPEDRKALPRTLGEKHGLPVLFYVEQHETSPTMPDGAYAMTHRPDHLLHLLFDALEGRPARA